VRDPGLLALAQRFGATEVHHLPGTPDALAGAFDVVIDTTGTPAGLDTAVVLARREVHLKSTHGQPAAGLRHLTELVVDELAIARWPLVPPAAAAAAWERAAAGSRPQLAWLAAAPPPAWLLARADVHRGPAAALATQLQQRRPGLGRADGAVADTAAAVDAVIRPHAGDERSLLRPRGTILLHPAAAPFADSPLLTAIATSDLRLSSSRCGDFHAALQLLATDAELARIGERLVTHHFRADDLVQAFATARSRGCIKAVVEHPAGAA
jgi:threonine dehydrogenase-like Zn-dependent dehydrogenase